MGAQSNFPQSPGPRFRYAPGCNGKEAPLGVSKVYTVTVGIGANPYHQVMTPERQRVVTLLKAEIERRQERNAAYSLRALARDAGLSPAVLSLVMNGKRALTLEKAMAIADKLKLTADIRQALFQAVSEDHDIRVDPTKRRTRAMEDKMAYMQLRMDQFTVIGDWWHFALLNLAKLRGFRSDVSWMAEKLAIDPSVCGEALERLRRLGLMELKNGEWKRTARPLETPTDIPSQAIRNFHRQTIARAVESMEESPLDERDITSIMLVTDKAKLEEAKRRIRLFRKELAEFLDAEGGDEVYSLNIQLFPQTRRKA